MLIYMIFRCRCTRYFVDMIVRHHIYLHIVYGGQLGNFALKYLQIVYLTFEYNGIHVCQEWIKLDYNKLTQTFYSILWWRQSQFLHVLIFKWILSELKSYGYLPIWWFLDMLLESLSDDLIFCRNPTPTEILVITLHSVVI